VFKSFPRIPQMPLMCVDIFKSRFADNLQFFVGLTRKGTRTSLLYCFLGRKKIKDFQLFFEQRSIIL